MKPQVEATCVSGATRGQWAMPLWLPRMLCAAPGQSSLGPKQHNLQVLVQGLSSQGYRSKEDHPLDLLEMKRVPEASLCAVENAL